MIVNKFTIRGFKSIESAELDLGNVNVFIGANGSGKSNLLKRSVLWRQLPLVESTANHSRGVAVVRAASFDPYFAIVPLSARLCSKLKERIPVIESHLPLQSKLAQPDGNSGAKFGKTVMKSLSIVRQETKREGGSAGRSCGSETC